MPELTMRLKGWESLHPLYYYFMLLSLTSAIMGLQKPQLSSMR
jgi:hypothetical protein